MTERINISLPDDLAHQVREANLPVSRICQDALRTALEKWNGTTASHTEVTLFADKVTIITRDTDDNPKSDRRSADRP